MDTRDSPLVAQAESPNSGYPDVFDASGVVAQLGAEVARALTAALERVSTLAATGQVDRDDLRELRDEITLARRVGIMGQQLVRLGKSDVSLSRERIALTDVLREALQLRQRETRARGIDVRHSFADVAMFGDETLTFSLIETLLDWVLEHTGQRVAFRLECKQNPTRARLSCAFLRRPTEDPSTLDTSRHRDVALSTMSWRLLKQMAYVMGLQLRRRDEVDRCEMRLSFPGADTVHATLLPGLDAEYLSGLPVLHVPPLEGRHLVVLAAQRDLRTQVREALRPTGSMIDFVSTLEEAQRLFEDALPHAVIYEASQGGERFQRMRLALMLEAPQLAFVEVVEQGSAVQALELDGLRYSRVGRDGLVDGLPAALLAELTHAG